MADYTIDLNRKNVKKKVEKIKEVEADMKNYKSLALIELKNLPDVLLQTSRKKIREEGGKVIVAKKVIFQKILEKDKKLTKFLEMLGDPVALILSNSTPYELNKFFKTNKKKMAAKVGQTAPYEIVVPEGETELPPGPALSELKVAGIAVQIKAGKIAISKDSVLAKEGEEITDKKAKALQMLGILPFEKYVNILYAYDGEYVYGSDVLDIDEQYVSEGMSRASQQGVNFSLNANYPTGSTANILITQAVMQGKNLAINGKVYSEGTVEQLLSLASNQGMALSDLKPAEEKPKEEKSEAKPEAEPSKEDVNDTSLTDVKSKTSQESKEKSEEKPKEEKKEK